MKLNTGKQQRKSKKPKMGSLKKSIQLIHLCQANQDTQREDTNY